jgi:hypothetical protein
MISGQEDIIVGIRLVCGAIGGERPGIVRNCVASPGEDEAQVSRGQIVIDAETESKSP